MINLSTSSKTRLFSYPGCCVLVAVMLIGATVYSSTAGTQSLDETTVAKASSVTPVAYHQDTAVEEQQENESSEENSDGTKIDETEEAEPQDDNTSGVQGDVDTEIRDEAAKRREKLVQEAIDAVAETRTALDALDKKNNDEALAALERVVGKLELLVARDPQLRLVPISQGVVAYDLWASIDTVQEEVDAAKDLLNDGEVQMARRILDDLASEVVISVTHLPLATYPQAIKSISPLIDNGKVDEAKSALQAALNTLVVTHYSLPLPVMRAQALLKSAEALTENQKRTDEQSDDLESLLDSARKQLELAQVLGYGKQSDYQPLYDEISKIEGKTEEGKSGKGFFDTIKDSLSEFRKNLFGS